MKLAVVIGGIASGKSTVSKVFGSHGAKCIDLDVIGHDVLRNESVKSQLCESFGAEILGEDGEVIRPKLAERAFVSPETTAVLNKITHTQIIADAWQIIAGFEAEGAQVCVVEISPYDGPEGTFGVFTDKANATIAVVAPVETRIARAVAKGFKEEDARNRIARQVSDESRRAWATHTLVNDGTAEELSRKIEDIWAELTA